MPAPAIDLLCADLGLIAYESTFLTAPQDTVAAALAPMGRSLVNLIWGEDAEIGPVPFGFISESPAGFITTLRGTQMPDGKIVEWLDDFDAFLETCPFAPGRWHRGAGRLYKTLNVNGQPLGRVLMSFAAMIIHGHSLAGWLATYAALESQGQAPRLFATPKGGDAPFRDAAISIWGGPATSYANPNDAVPKVPITVDWPFKIEDFEQVSPLIELAPSSVTPPIASNWDDSHQLSNYRRLLAAIP